MSCANDGSHSVASVVDSLKAAVVSPGVYRGTQPRIDEPVRDRAGCVRSMHDSSHQCRKRNLSFGNTVDATQLALRKESAARSLDSLEKATGLGDRVFGWGRDVDGRPHRPEEVSLHDPELCTGAEGAGAGAAGAAPAGAAAEPPPPPPEDPATTTVRVTTCGGGGGTGV